MTPAPLPTEEIERQSPDDIRALGWSVAVHNDYRLDGAPHTFWLFTKDGRALKGEGRTDAEALDQIRTALLAEIEAGRAGADHPRLRHAFIAGWNAAHGMTPNHGGSAWHDYWSANLAPWASPKAAQPAGRVDRFSADDHDIEAETDRATPPASGAVANASTCRGGPNGSPIMGCEGGSKPVIGCRCRQGAADDGADGG